MHVINFHGLKNGGHPVGIGHVLYGIGGEHGR